jgi:hypothetical protein
MLWLLLEADKNRFKAGMAIQIIFMLMLWLLLRAVRKMGFGGQSRHGDKVVMVRAWRGAVNMGVEKR